ncbi:hypothetical protein PN836_009360 [Ningiella sp. W23]|uniref:hypothetical protein n=1 Tax=Ningiella sp. W23 TaxID=3023715 RepID=UPI003756B610
MDSLALAGIAGQLFDSSDGLSIRDINQGVVKLMQTHACDSKVARQFESNLLNYWNKHQPQTQKYADRLKKALNN